MHRDWQESSKSSGSTFQSSSSSGYVWSLTGLCEEHMYVCTYTTIIITLIGGVEDTWTHQLDMVINPTLGQLKMEDGNFFFRVVPVRAREISLSRQVRPSHPPVVSHNYLVGRVLCAIFTTQD